MERKTYTYPSGKQSSTGSFKNGKPIGLWTNFYESGQKSSEGIWKENGLDSIWIFYTKKGEIERSISYANNLKNGPYLKYDSLQKIEFDGLYVNDTLQGPFRKFLNGLLIEEGNYKNGKLNGVLREFDASGEVKRIVNYNDDEEIDERQINRLVNGRREGLWEFYDKEGKLVKQELYKNGELVKDDSDPTLSFTFEKEYHASGNLKSQYAVKDGLKNGAKSNFDENGIQLASEIYKNDTLMATGWFTSDGSKDSLWQFYYPNREIQSKGKFKDGMKEGMWIYYFPNKAIEQKGRYHNDLPTGEWTWNYPNGQVRRLESFFKGRYEGDIIDYDTTGAIIQKQTYTYDTQEGDYFYFIGDHQEKGKFQNGLRQGKWIYYYGEKKKAFVGKYKNGVEEGKHKIWFENGKLAYLIPYKKGKIHGQKLEYNERGVLLHTYLYKNGKLITIDGLSMKENKILIQD